MNADLPLLGWQSHSGEVFNPALMLPIVDRLGWPVKPTGGLWTSPVHPDGGTHWTQWCIREDYGNQEAPMYPIVPNPGAAVYVIDSLADLLSLEGKYPLSRKPRDTAMWPNVSWEKAAADWDSIWLTEAGEGRTRHSLPGLYGWDCETVFWLRPAFTALLEKL